MELAYLAKPSVNASIAIALLIVFNVDLDIMLMQEFVLDVGQMLILIVLFVLMIQLVWTVSEVIGWTVAIYVKNVYLNVCFVILQTIVWNVYQQCMLQVVLLVIFAYFLV